MMLPLLLFCLINASECIEEETTICEQNSSYFQWNIQEFVLSYKNFTDMTKSCDFFVDRSLLLKEIFKENSPYLTVFYLPRRFSKTTNLQMIESFAAIELYPNTWRVARQFTWAYNFFTQGKILSRNYTVSATLRAPPLISHHKDLVEKHIVKYPVIYLDFSDIHTIDFQTTWNCLKDRIGRAFRKYHFFVNRIKVEEATRFQNLVDYFNRTEWSIGPSAEPIDLIDTLNFLAEKARDYFYYRPILCVDEYDSMLGAFLHRHYVTNEECDKVLKLFNEFVDKVFSRDDLYSKVILTGTYGIHKNIMKELPGTKAIYTSFDNELSHFFGYTESNIRALAKHHSGCEPKLERMLEYYKGYQMCRKTIVYNPWAVINFLKWKHMRDNWNTEKQHNWFTTSFWFIDELRELWLDLLSDQVKSFYYRLEKFNENDFRTIQNTLSTTVRTEFTANNTISLPAKLVIQIICYQLDLGYLSCSNMSSHGVRAANDEAKAFIFERMRQAYNCYIGASAYAVNMLASQLNGYLFSRNRQQLLQELTESFRILFAETIDLFENSTTAEGSPTVKVTSKGVRIVEFLAMRLRHERGHRVERKIPDGFIATKLGVSSMVVFNYDLSVTNDDVLNRIDNYTHSWTELRPGGSITSVTYLVIGLKNGAEISEKHYGEEPPEDITTPASVEESTTPGKKTKGPRGTPATKKKKTGSKSLPKVTQLMNDTRPRNGTCSMTARSTVSSKGETSSATVKSTGSANHGTGSMTIQLTYSGTGSTNVRVTHSEINFTTTLTSSTESTALKPELASKFASIKACQFNATTSTQFNNAPSVQGNSNNTPKVTEAILQEISRVKRSIPDAPATSETDSVLKQSTSKPKPSRTSTTEPPPILPQQTSPAELSPSIPPRSPSADSTPPGSKPSPEFSRKTKGTKASRSWTKGSRQPKIDGKQPSSAIPTDQSQPPFESVSRRTKPAAKFETTVRPTTMISYQTWEHVSWRRRPRPTYSTKATTIMSRVKYLRLLFMVRDCDLRPNRKNPYYYVTAQTEKNLP